MSFQAETRHQIFFCEPFLGIENAKDDVFFKVTDDVSIGKHKSLHGLLTQDCSGKRRHGNNIIRNIINNLVDTVCYPMQSVTTVRIPCLFSTSKGTAFQMVRGRTRTKELYYDKRYWCRVAWSWLYRPNAFFKLG